MGLMESDYNTSMEDFISRALSRRNIIRGTLFFTVCTIIGLSIGLLWSDTEKIWTVLRSIRVHWLLLSVFCMGSDWLSGAVQLHIFVRKMSPQVTFLDSIRARLASICVGGITPLQTGGVAHIYIYNRVGVPVSGGITIAIISFITTLAFWIFVACSVLVWNPDVLPKQITLVSHYSVLMLIIVFLVFVMMVIKPEALIYLVARLRLPQRRGFRFISSVLQKLTLRLERLILEHKAFIRMFTTEHKRVWVLSPILSGSIYISRFICGYLIVRALGGDAPFWDIVAIQVLLQFVILCAPSPGASGIAEFLTVVLMKNFLPVGAVGIYTLLMRFFNCYLAIAVGGVVLIRQLAKDFSQQKQ